MTNTAESKPRSSCLTPHCPNKPISLAARLFCGQCMMHLPAEVNTRYLPRWAEQLGDSRTPHHIRQAAMIGVRAAGTLARALTNAEARGDLTPREEAEFTALVHKYMGPDWSVAELLNAKEGYRPDWAAIFTAPNGEMQRDGARMCLLYDWAQAVRGDARRSVKLGHCGL